MIHVYLKNCEKFCTAANILFSTTYLTVENNIFLISKSLFFKYSQHEFIFFSRKKGLFHVKIFRKNAFECCKLNSKHTINLNCTNKYTRQRVLKFGLDSYNVIIYAKWNKINKPVI